MWGGCRRKFCLSSYYYSDVDNKNTIYLYDAISNLKLLYGATNKNVNKHDQLRTLR